MYMHICTQIMLQSSVKECSYCKFRLDFETEGLVWDLLLLQLFISPKRRAYIFRVFFYLQITNYVNEKKTVSNTMYGLIAEIGVLPDCETA
jgi:hypothetical protein